LEKIIFENFNISENNIISVELAKVLGYYLGANASNMDKVQTTIGQGSEPVSCKYIFYTYIYLPVMVMVRVYLFILTYFLKNNIP
jgi:hypothetical protein